MAALRTLQLLCGLVLLAGLAPAARAAAPRTFTLEISPDHGTLTDTFVATVQIRMDGIAGPDRYWQPDFREFKVIDSQKKLDTTSRIDPKLGQRLETVVLYRYVLSPKRVGSLLVGPARVRIHGDEYESRAARIRVRGSGGTAAPGFDDDSDPMSGDLGGVPGFRPPDSSLAGSPMFLHAVADKDEVYAGEQVTVTWLLYTRAEILEFEPRPPRLDDYWSEILYEPDAFFTYHDDRVGRVSYVVAMVSKRALFPTTPGKAVVPPFEAKVSTLSTALGKSERLRSKPITLEVKPLPGGAPAGFDPSYVGRFTAEAAVDRTHIDAADALTLTLTIRGRGAIRRTAPPELAFPGFEFQSPRDFDEDVDLSGDVVEGERIYRYWTTPTKGGRQLIPAIDVPFFDPETERYDIARTRPISVFIEGEPGAAAVADTGSKRENLITRDIKLQRDGDSVSSGVALRMHDSSWFWIFALSPPLLFSLVVITDRVRQRLKKETPRARLRRARGRAKQRFRVAEIHLRGDRPAKFFAELAHVVTEHLAERAGVEVRSMTRDEMRSFLGEKGFDETTVKQILESLETFDFARFAPTAAGAAEMRTALRRTKDLLRRIERARLIDDEDEVAA